MNLMIKQAGLSLIELMIAITLGLILMTGVMQIFISSKVVFSTQQGMARIQETGRLAIDFMSRDISSAGYYGCYHPIPTPVPNLAPNPQMLNGTPLNLGGLHGNFELGIMGYDSAALLPVGGVPVNLGLTVAATLGTSILVIHSANQEGYILSSTTGTNTSLVAQVPVGTTLVQPTPCVGNICAGAAAVVSDCEEARVFQIPAGNTLALAGTKLTVTHALWNPVNPLYKGLDGVSFRADAELRPMNTIVYFLAAGAGGSSSLFQKTNLNEPIELLEGVEKMNITYSTTTNAVYRQAAALAPNDWGIVNAVRVELVVRSIANNVIGDRDHGQPYTYMGNVIDPMATDPKDRYLRQVFITTVFKRN